MSHHVPEFLAEGGHVLGGRRRFVAVDEGRHVRRVGKFLGLGQVGVETDAVGLEVLGHRFVHAEGDGLGKFGLAQARNPGLVIAHVLGRSRVLTLGGAFDVRQGPLRANAGRLCLGIRPAIRSLIGQGARVAWSRFLGLWLSFLAPADS